MQPRIATRRRAAFTTPRPATFFESLESRGMAAADAAVLDFADAAADYVECAVDAPPITDRIETAELPTVDWDPTATSGDVAVPAWPLEAVCDFSFDPATVGPDAIMMAFASPPLDRDEAAAPEPGQSLEPRAARADAAAGGSPLGPTLLGWAAFSTDEAARLGSTAGRKRGARPVSPAV